MSNSTKIAQLIAQLIPTVASASNCYFTHKKQFIYFVFIQIYLIILIRHKKPCTKLF